MDKPTAASAETMAGLALACFEEMGFGEPFVIGRECELVSPREGTSLGYCMKLSVWLDRNVDHPIVQQFMGRERKPK